MNVNLKAKTFCIFGLRGSGKSTLANYICEQFGSKALLYDTLGEAPASAKYFSYTPVRTHSDVELSTVIDRIMDNPAFKLFMIDECNRYAPSKPAPIPPKLAEFNDQCRHYGQSLGFIARRPVQLNQDLTELSDYMFIFHLTGKRDIKYLNDIVDGLGDTVLKLKGFQFVLVLPDRSFRVNNPIAASDRWLNAAKRHLRGV